MNPIRKTLAWTALAIGTLTAAQGCIPVIVGGTGAAVAMATDRRSSGTYVEDEGIEWKASNRINERLGDKVHVNATSFNRKLLLTGEAFNEASREEAGRIAAAVENVKEVVNDLRIAPTSTLSARGNDSYISSKVKARFVDQKDFRIQQVKVTTEAGTVFLMGLVTEKEGNAATEVARTTNGVQKVVRVFEYISEDEARRLDNITGSSTK
ncbi:BON domain-containing protein [Zoogloea sp.]|jgi:osmotically-inducible protein OsmY|uniref:BON domain-containing protein n=1 Tax=Zoogloea sp. TaxID=49181 RepID=UPI001DC9A3B4|nr:BON domain-containing protein [Zoogloea sp.]MBK6656060.1 BON domain-containing protein [Zoogloea sp.]MBK7848750.1 BON domain-containing protein [Zoogloea sp.]